MGKYLAFGAAFAALLSMATAKADIIVKPNDRHDEVGASNPRDLDVQYRHKHRRIGDIDDDDSAGVDKDIRKAFEDGSLITGPPMPDINVGLLDNMRPVDPPDVPEPRSAALLIGALIGFFLIRRYLPPQPSV